MAKKSSLGLLPKIFIIVGAIAAACLVGYFVISALNSSVVDSISIEAAYSELYVGNPQYGSIEYNVRVYPETALNKNYAVFSSDSTIATAEITAEGKVKVNAVSAGSATISVQSLAKTSLVDHCEVVVKNTDVQNLSFIQTIGSDEIISSVSVQKDGLEHEVYFNLDPVDANMGKLSLSYDKTIFENVYINYEKQCLVLIPRTEIETSVTNVYVEINQETVDGVVASKYIEIRVNLLEREAYLRFSFANSVNDEFSYNHSNFVYLCPNGDVPVNTFYMNVDIGYDNQFNNMGVFNINDYAVFINNNEVISDQSTATSFTYGAFTIEKIISENCYRITANSTFTSGDYQLSLKHRYTGAVNFIEIIYMPVITSGEFGINTPIGKTGATTKTPDTGYRYSIRKGTYSVLQTSFDQAIEASILDLYITNGEDIGNGVKRIYNTDRTEYIDVHRNGDRIWMYAYTENITDDSARDDTIDVNLRYRISYWDSRYNPAFGGASTSEYTLSFYIENVYLDNSSNFITINGNSAELTFKSTLCDLYDNYFNENDIVVTTAEGCSISAVNYREKAWVFEIEFTATKKHTLVFTYGGISITVYITNR